MLSSVTAVPEQDRRPCDYTSHCLVRPRWWAGIALAAAVAIVAPTGVHAEPTAVTTFECISLYQPSSDKSVCSVQYRVAGAPEWRAALDLVYDPRNQEHRGS